ncbi:MAG TPA: SEFIR domain-containing protein [Pseudonocardiaceae bacterium]|nr:SEFIR domain-containing protein [Pseudonocardiaceae bacterium]
MINTDEAGDDAPRVFVSYTHDNDTHKALVLEFATFLRGQGIDAELDQWFTDRRRDWYTWVLKLTRRADFIVVVASPVFRQVGDGNVGSDENRGAQSEASLFRELLHSDRETWGQKLLPVVLPGYTPDDIPLFLQPRTADHYSVTAFSTAGAVDLLRVLTDQPSHLRPPLGPRPVLPTTAGKSISDTTAGTGSITQSGGGQHVANTGIVGGDFRVYGSRP